MVVTVSPDGTVTVVAHAEKDRAVLEALGQVETVRRGGHVVPSQRPLRVAFRLVRRALGRFPAVAAWTRTWPVAWVADLGVSGGPVLGPFADRAAAIEAEERWLAENVIGGSEVYRLECNFWTPGAGLCGWRGTSEEASWCEHFQEWVCPRCGTSDGLRVVEQEALRVDD